MFIIWNNTDNISASPKKFRSKERATGQIIAIRDRYRQQGYYKTSSGDRIYPDEIKYEVIEEPKRIKRKYTKKKTDNEIIDEAIEQIKIDSGCL